MTTLKKVLVVDDDPVVGRSFDRVLSTKGYAVITATNGEEALAKLAAEDYDVVYTDIRMPGMDGIEVATRAKAGRPWMPVVIVTGYGSAENMARAKAAGVATVLHKPLSPEMIETSAHEALAVKPAAVLLPPPMPAARAAPPAAAPAAEPEAESDLVTAARTWGGAVAAPFVGLAYVVLFPLIGLAALLRTGAKALAARSDRIGRFARNVGLFVAAPFVGLLYTLALPFVGLGLIAMMAWKAYRGRGGE